MGFPAFWPKYLNVQIDLLIGETEFFLSCVFLLGLRRQLSGCGLQCLMSVGCADIPLFQSTLFALRLRGHKGGEGHMTLPNWESLSILTVFQCASTGAERQDEADEQAA